ncbi:hypothetical protein LOZ12_002247 [Ophidiomyces ophidiicola]|uniref:Uncharacterized protein n=1 Tax=Ophidiomyces ophidiicola TaxID=1387563 RepID=A0ACB8UYT6_9EURO|nr:hypothetical protein LOZ64_002055 [Ophidiomyces ophidiicola]KAI1950053.1 hypothetical protein LOZ62_002036 [Ophidiomyces ophidiicola]KAI1959450.1 hypothetical protein LOZ59_003053 [Ophidiomyces ophidiicola]KAI1973789.1 hypothetical protein LOZ56_001645 [Ophidiomyces ophidiicola]KAI2032271.1 hypothetical protein LOZ45_001142 [Ophidiomyces ophidiicola]
MPAATAPILAPYTSPPPRHSLSLITSLLGTTSNWLVLRFICDALYSASQLAPRGPAAGAGIEDESQAPGEGKGPLRIVLVSFLRGWDFWKGEGKRLGIDLARLALQGKFVFVDGLTGLFSTANQNLSKLTPPASMSPAVHSTTAPHRLANRSHTASQETNVPTKLQWSNTGGVEAIERAIISAIDSVNSSAGEDDRITATSNTLLIVDQPDMLLAATGVESKVGALEVKDMITCLRQHAHSTLVTLAADSPFINYGESGTPLETEHASLVIGMAYQARMVMQLRGLETGAARDVSGVMQIAKGRLCSHADQRDLDSDDLEPIEILYYVQGDGTVRVFGRGE